MKTLVVLEPSKLTPEEVAALRKVGFNPEPSLTYADLLTIWNAPPPPYEPVVVICDADDKA
jgi:hypothetical protein